MELANWDFRRDADNSDLEIRDDGLIYCTRCGGCMQTLLPLTGAGEGQTALITHLCPCRSGEKEAQQEADEKARKAKRVELYRVDGIDNPTYLEYTFSADDSPSSTPSILARQYVKGFQRMKDNGIGLIMYGTVGTGKTFYAACIANALIEKGIRVKMTTLSTIIASAYDDKKWREKQNRYDLLILDDLGAERQTDYALEIAYTVIDDRVNSGLPLIVTTNLSEEDMANTGNLTLKRVYDRVLSACPIDAVLVGTSRRATSREGRRNEAISILMDDDGDE